MLMAVRTKVFSSAHAHSYPLLTDGSQDYRDEQQAWRYLGLFVDCNPEAEIGDGGCVHCDYGDDDGSYYDDDSYNGDDGGGNNDDQARFLQEGERENVNTTCNRYVLYAAVSSSDVVESCMMHVLVSQNGIHLHSFL